MLEAASLLGKHDGLQSKDQAQSKRASDHLKGVGEIVERGEFGLGVAPKDSRPVHKIELTKEQEAEMKDAQAYEAYSQGPLEEDIEATFTYLNLNSKKKTRTDKRRDLNKQDAFLEFKLEEDGQQLEQSIKDNRNELKNIKSKVKDLTEQCNISKKAIDSVKSELDKKQDQRRAANAGSFGVDDNDFEAEDQHEIIDEDELQMLTHLKDLKKTYRATFQQLKTSKDQLAAIQSSIDHAK